jgi:beta-lactamase class A
MSTQEINVLKQIEAEMQTIPGHLGFYYKNLVTGLEYGVREEEAYLAASVIKLPLYLHILQQWHRGELHPEDLLTVTEEDKMPSCGALTLFTGDVTVNLRTLCRLMIVLSDNTATNKLIRLCTIEGANATFREMGLEQTVLRRLLFDAEASAAGLQNTVSPKEMGMLLEQLYRNTFVSKEVCREAMDTLLLQQVDHKLGGKLFDAPIAHKTGEDENLSNDVGIVFAKEPFILCFTGHDTDVYRWEDLMRRAAFDLHLAQEKHEAD